jgi:anti-sigma28 factor (negative regulator of flagellin synthesis)
MVNWRPDSEEFPGLPPGGSSWSSAGADSWWMTRQIAEPHPARVKRLRRDIANGTYHVPANLVADAIMRFFAR